MIRKYWVQIIFIFISLCCTMKPENDNTMGSSSSANESEQEPSKKYLALGDSYTIGESVSPELRWPVILVNHLQAKGYKFTSPEIIATTGWTTDELKAGINQNEPMPPYDLVSLLIGVNNQYRGQDINVFRREFEELLNMAIQFADDNRNRVFVLSIPDYSVTPFSEGKDREKISREIDNYNEICRSLTEEYGIAYYDITPISRMAKEIPDLLAEDGLHPSGEMYSKWVDHIGKDIVKQLQ